MSRAEAIQKPQGRYEIAAKPTMYDGIKIEGRVMDHAHGVWAGVRPQWFTATHIPTGFAVTWHENCHSGMSQHRQREAALACLRLMIDEMRPAELPMVHPNEQGKERTG